MTQVKITALPAYTDPVSTDVLPIVDVSADLTKKVSIADLLENAGTGSASAPSFAFDGDSDTGIYRPGADQVAISTNGTGRLFIDASGNVSIGSNSSISAAFTVVSQANAEAINVRGRSADNIGEINFWSNNEATRYAKLSARSTYVELRGPDSGSIQFNKFDGTQFAIIDSSGRLGLGTSSPGQQMVVRGSQPFLEIRDSRTGNWDAEDVFSGILFASDDTTGDYNPQTFIKTVHTRAGTGHSAADAGLTFGCSESTTTAAIERMRLTHDGRLGVGTTSPAVSLHISDSAATQLRLNSSGSSSGIQFFDAATTDSVIIGTVGDELRFRTDQGSYTFRTNNNAGEAVRIDSSGNVGIGTSSPAGRLEIKDGGYRQGIILERGGTTVDRGFIYIGDGTNSTIADEIYVDAHNTAIHFRQGNTGTTETVYFGSTGNVGVGTTTPGGKFQVVTGGSGGNVLIDAEASSAYHAKVVNGTGDLILGSRNTSADTYVVSNRSILFKGTSSESEVGRFDSSGRLLVGTSTARQTGTGFTAFSQIESGSSVSGGSFTITSNRSIDDLGGRINFARSKGGSLGSNTAVDADAELGGIYFWGADGTDLNSQAAQITAYVDGTPGANNMPGRLVFSTTAAGNSTPTERMRIDSSGRLLVGTSSSSANTRAIFQASSTSSTAAGDIRIQRGSANPALGAALGVIYFTDSTESIGASVIAASDGTWTTGTSYPTRLVFSTTADGASSPTTRFTLNRVGDAVFSNTSAVYPATDNAATIGGSSNRWSAVWAANGTIQTSDERLKTEIANSSLATDFVKSLRPVSYKWIEGGKRHTGEYDEDNNLVYETIAGTRTHWGFIAQEVKQSADDAGVDFGGWVLADKDDADSIQSLRYDQFVAPLTAALQEAIAKIETLEAKVAALESA